MPKFEVTYSCSTRGSGLKHTVVALNKAVAEIQAKNELSNSTQYTIIITEVKEAE